MTVEIEDCDPDTRLWLAFTHSREPAASIFEADVVMPQERLLRDLRFNRLFVAEGWYRAFRTKRDAREWVAAQFAKEAQRFIDAGQAMLAEEEVRA